jgi:hypothetical protein
MKLRRFLLALLTPVSLLEAAQGGVRFPFCLERDSCYATDIVVVREGVRIAAKPKLREYS